MEDIYSDKRIKEYRKKNWEEAIVDFEKKEEYILNKIKHISADFDIPETEIYDIIYKSNDQKIKDLFIAVRLSKDPKRQNIYENIFHDYVKKNKRDMKKLPSGGAKSVYLTIRGLSQGGKDHSDSTKSLDFYEKIGDREIFYYHKYTEHSGGAQANQYNDLQTFLRLAVNYCKNNQDMILFVAVADGPFYNEAKMDYLAQIAGKFIDKRIFVIKWYDLLQKLHF